MKVVLFCGGQGTRLREHSESLPKPMISIGFRPILWHVMRYYAHYGHKEFILCLGYKADVIKDYFLNYDEAVSNDFVLSDGGETVQLLQRDIFDWKITFVDTGVQTNIGQRLRKVRRHLEEEEAFLANYTDGVSDLPLPDFVDYFNRRGKIACFTAVRPTGSFHLVSSDLDGTVTSIRHLAHSDTRINGGFFMFRREIFDFIGEGEDLVEEPFQRLIQRRQLIAYPYDGFWACMDTFKEKQLLDDMYTRGDTPWEVWRSKESDESISRPESDRAASSSEYPPLGPPH
jgi:glucose-1-phosphate cytidylyltransferase